MRDLHISTIWHTAMKAGLKMPMSEDHQLVYNAVVGEENRINVNPEVNPVIDVVGQPSVINVNPTISPHITVHP